MNQERLEQMQKEIKREKDLKLKLRKVEERLKELRKTKEVQEYLALTELDTEKNHPLISETEETLENKIIFAYLEDSPQKGDIYYCLGKNLNAYHSYILNIESYGATKVARYISLTSTHQLIIEIGKEQEFEKENQVILTSVPTIEEYHKIQREYFEKAFETSEEESKQYILGKYKQKE